MAEQAAAEPIVPAAEPARSPSRIQRPLHFALEAAVGIAIVAIFGLLVDGDRVSAIERSVFEFVNGFPGFLERPLWAFMQVGNLLAAPVAAVVALAVRRWRLALGFMLAGIGKLALARVVKMLIERHRPHRILEDVIRRDDFGGGLAFVSGHAVIAVALAVIAHPYLGRRGRILVWTAAALVCIGRVYVGAHLPLDVVAGAALGWALGAVINLVIGVPASQKESTHHGARDQRVLESAAPNASSTERAP